MTTSTKEQTEKDFLKLKSTMSKKEWDDPNHLLQLANSYEDDNPALSLRILKRVKNLNNLNNKHARSTEARLESLLEEKQQKRSLNQKVKPDISSTTTTQNIEEIEVAEKSTRSWFLQLYKKPLFIFVIFPWLIFFIYQVFLAAPRFVSGSQVIVEQPDSMATMDTGMAILSGLGMQPNYTDAELVKTFIHSADLISYIDSKIKIKEHYSSQDADFISRLDQSSSKEQLYSYFRKHVEVNVDQKSQVIAIDTQAFTPEFAQLLNELIVKRAEWYINQIGNKLAEEQLSFVQKEHDLIEDKIRKAKKELLEFQSSHGLLDPEAEGMAIQKIAYSIEGLLAQKEAERRALESVMNESAPQITTITNEISALEEQLKTERNRLTDTGNGESVSEILTKFLELKVDMELALQAYTSSRISLEKSRVEAYRQIKYLVVVQSSTLPEDNTYPKVIYNLALLAVVLLMLFGVGKIIYSTIHEISK